MRPINAEGQPLIITIQFNPTEGEPVAVGGLTAWESGVVLGALAVECGEGPELRRLSDAIHRAAELLRGEQKKTPEPAPVGRSNPAK